jgi:hypothetical protein
MADPTPEEGLKALLALALLPAIYILEGFVFMRLWAWHVVPVFHLGPMSIGHAIGVSTFIGVVRFRPSEPREEKPPLVVIKEHLMVAGVALLVGWLASG